MTYFIWDSSVEPGEGEGWLCYILVLWKKVYIYVYLSSEDGKELSFAEAVLLFQRVCINIPTEKVTLVQKYFLYNSIQTKIK